VRSRLVAALAAVLLAPAFVSCDDSSPLSLDGGSVPGGGGGEGGGNATEPPRALLCRVLDLEAITAPSDDTDPVDCSEPHNAETFYVGEFEDADDLAYDDPSLGAQVYQQCQRRYMRFVGANPSLAMRSVIDWAWWRPSEDDWDDGARWYRCDVVGGNEDSKEMVNLPTTAKGVLLGIPEPKWMLCAAGPVVAEAPKVPCSEPHVWRAVSVVVVGKPKDKWPGPRVVEVNTRDYCSDWVGAWLNYPLDYEYGYTWFGKAEWEAGNRQSVCWARTEE
jgi:hypothetical protein